MGSRTHRAQGGSWVGVVSVFAFFGGCAALAYQVMLHFRTGVWPLVRLREILPSLFTGAGEGGGFVSWTLGTLGAAPLSVFLMGLGVVLAGVALLIERDVLGDGAETPFDKKEGPSVPPATLF